jgi:hypothetical protein
VSARYQCTPEHPWSRADCDDEGLVVAHSDVDEFYGDGWVYECRSCGARWLAGGEELPR